MQACNDVVAVLEGRRPGRMHTDETPSGDNSIVTVGKMETRGIRLQGSIGCIVEKCGDRV
jgi:hypothetical protein